MKPSSIRSDPPWVSRLACLWLFGLLLALASCGGGPGNFAVVLWAPQGGPLANGDQVSVVRLGEDSGKATVRAKRVKGTVELEAWRLRLVPNRDQLRAEAEAYAPYARSFAYAQRDGLPLREDPQQEARRVYKLREGQVVKVLSRGEQKVQVASYEDYWYRVLTDDGYEGWSFGYFLPVFESSGDPLAEAAELKAKDPLLDALQATAWRPEFFQEMVDNGRIDLERFSPDTGFFLDATRKQALLSLPGFRQSWDYREITNVGPSRYVIAGPELRVTMSGPQRMVLTYPRKEQQLAQVFINFTGDLGEIIEAEKARRQALFQEFLRRGAVLTSNAYGRIRLSEGMRFQWEGFGRLADQAFLRPVAGNGAVDFPYHLSPELAASFDGVITFRFAEYGPSQGSSFVYKFDGPGVRLVFLRAQAIQDSVALGLEASPLVIYFSFGGS
jgi:hypothetical protein